MQKITLTKKKLRNSVLFNIYFYNQLRKAIDALWNMNIGKTEDEDEKEPEQDELKAIA